MFNSESQVPFSNQTALARIIDQPPFYFRGVTMRIFPVRANLATLGQFCDQYVNFVPGEIARYEPFVPFVYLCLINYGRMQQIQDTGWVAQNEIAFTIPLQWHRKEGERWVFQDMVSFSPFIFVDVEMSEITGREVYGWPKEYAFLTRDLAKWARYPNSASNLLSVERRTESDNSPDGWKKAKFLDVVRQPLPSFSMVPTDWDALTNPMALASRASWGAWFAASTLGGLATASPLRGFSSSGSKSVPKLMEQFAQSSAVMSAGPFAPGSALERSLSSLTMNLKQFHMARRPDKACYQAVVHSKMKLDRFNRGGLLGEANVLLGDPTGGFQLKLFRRTAGNLIDALGLEDSRKVPADDAPAVILKPFLPYWVDLDLTYGVGEPIGWRLLGEEAPPEEDGAAGTKSDFDLSWKSSFSDEPVEHREGDTGDYRDARAVPWEATVGPYHAPQVARRVMTLRTDGSGALERFCDTYLNAPLEAPTRARFEPWGDMALLVVSNYDSIVDGNGSVNSWVHLELSFIVPVIWRAASGKVIDVGFVHAFFFADNDIETILLRERIGFPVVRGSLESAQTIWINEFQPGATRVPLLTLKAEVLGAFYPGEKVEEKRLLEIEVSNMSGLETLRPPSGPGGPKTDRPKDVQAAVAKLEKAIRFNQPLQINRFTLKQYPDAADASRACYQSLIAAPEALTGPNVVPFASGSFAAVTIDRYPSFPIVETLGLKVDSSETVGERLRERLIPDEAFWVQSDTNFEKEIGFLWRGRDGVWKGERPGARELAFDPDKITPGGFIRGWMKVLRERDPDRSPLGEGT